MDFLTIFMWVSVSLGSKAAFLIICYILWRDEYHYSFDTIKAIWRAVTSLFRLPEPPKAPQPIAVRKRDI